MKPFYIAAFSLLIFTVGTSVCLIASFLEDDGLITVGTNKIPKYEHSVDDHLSPSPKPFVSGSLLALFPLKASLRGSWLFWGEAAGFLLPTCWC